MEVRAGAVVTTVTDDGVGGASADGGQGTGVTGLADQAEAFGGELRLSDAPGGGTILEVAIRLD
jgi:signal transduction histidine kinase